MASSRSFTVKRFATRGELGQRAAEDARETLKALWRTQAVVNMIFASAPSQLDFLSAFRCDPQIDFSRIRAFHMDEYTGLPAGAPQEFGQFLNVHLFSHARFHEVHYIDGHAPDLQEECSRYAKLLEQYPADIVCLGIGDNGHIAFNDPDVADFDDPAAVKVIALNDEVCRLQQVHAGAFPKVEDVPRQAITLTVPALTRAGHLFCMAPTSRKAEAVRCAVLGPVSERCPASILRTCRNATIYLDEESSSLLRPW